MTSMHMHAMNAEIAYRQDKLRADYRRAARFHHAERLRSMPTWLGRRHHTTDVSKAVDLA